MRSLLVILLSAMLVDNFVLSKFMGICAFLGVSKKFDSAVGMGAAVTFVMACAALATYPIYTLILIPLGLTYLKTVAFILVIALFVQIVEMFLKKAVPPLYKALGVYLPLITTNCAVLGVALTNVQENNNFITSVITGFGTAVGFALAIIIMAGIRERIENNDFPKAFKGTPAVLLTACLMAIAFYGFGSLK